MSQADEHRRKAAECHKQARLSITPLDQEQWLRLAAHWLKLAEADERETDD
jgi:predicted RNA-binding protein with PUA-like domain